MASLLPTVPLLLSLLFLTVASTSVVERACKATRFPDTCVSSLAPYSLPSHATPTDLILTALSVSAQKQRNALSMVRHILRATAGNPNRTNAAGNCIEYMGHAALRLARVADAVPRGRVKDARAWAGAVLLHQDGCLGGLKTATGTKLVDDTMSFLDSLTRFTSNALSMLAAYERYGGDISAWAPPQTERDGYWGDDGVAAGWSEQGSGGGFSGGFPADLPSPKAMVCRHGGEGRCYRTVQEAVDAAPNNGAEPFVIYIREGVYRETVRIPFEKTNVVFLGDGMGKTVITGSLNVGMLGLTTFDTATVGVDGDRFMAKGLTIENTAGPDAHQAVAFRSDSDLSVLEEVEFLGHQDTLYAHGLRQFYRSCRIAGTVDFIFGNAAAVFQDCAVLVRPRQLNPESGETSTVTAHARTDPAQATGLVFHNCTVDGTEEYVALYRRRPEAHQSYLGRPWKEFSRTVFVGCTLGEVVRPEGWTTWIGDFALKTLFYGEFESRGPGGRNTTARVAWSSQIPAEHVGVYSVRSFIQGDQWIPVST